MRVLTKNIRPAVFLFLVAAVLAAGCNGNGATPSNPPQNGGASPAAETSGTPTAAPSDTPAPARILFVIKLDPGGTYRAEFDAKLVELAEKSGYLLEKTESPSPDSLEGVKAVFWYGDPADFTRLAATASEIPFILVSSAEVESAPNIYQIKLSPARVSFIAGLVAILIAPDRRAGGLFSTEDPLNAQRTDAFQNGARYLCGRCVPVYAPVIFFPVTGSVSGGQGFDAWKTAFDQLDQNRIESLYLAPEGASREMLDYLTAQSVSVVGSAAPPEGFSSIWAATVVQDPGAALDQIWPDLFAPNSAGKKVNAPVILQDVNGLILTPGRKDLVERIAADLNAGWIEPLSVP